MNEWLNKLRLIVTDAVRGVVEGWAVIFTDASRKDPYGTYFDGSTDFDLRAYAKRPSYWHHGLEGARFGRDRVGYAVELAPAAKDGIEGLWARLELDVAHPQFAAMVEAIRSEVIGLSTGVVPGKREYAADGHVTRWHIAEVSPSERAALLRYTQVGMVRAELGLADDLADDVVLECRAVFGVPEPPHVVERPSGVVVPAGVVVPSAASQPVRNLFAPAAAAAAGVVVPPDSGLRSITMRDPLDDWSVDDMAFYLAFARIANRMPAMSPNRVVDNRFLRAFHGKVTEFLKTDAQADLGLRVFDPVDVKLLHDQEAGLLRADEVNNLVNTGYGDDFVPTVFSGIAWRNFRQASTVAQLFDERIFEASPADWPTVGTGPTVRKGIELEDLSDVDQAAALWKTSKIATDKVTFAAGELVAHVVWSERLQLFSQVDLVSEYRLSFEQAFADALDNVIINGDESTGVANISHLGTDPAGTVYDKLLIVDGLRHNCLVDLAANGSDAASAALAATMVNTGRKLMSGGKGLDVGNLVLVTDEASMYALMSLADVTTMDKLGAQATILKGMLGSIWGIPIVWSTQMEKVNADGMVEDSHDTLQGSLLIVHRPSVKIGRFKNVDIRAGEIPYAGGRWMVANVMFDLGRMDTDAIAYVFDYDV